jgi:hypothetical protein
VMSNVDVSVKGVHAKALLLVDLTNAVKVVDQTLTFVDNHPEAIPKQSAATGGGAASDGAPRLLLLGIIRDTAGHSVQRLVNAANGDILERVVAGVGQPVVERNVGNVAALTVLEPATNSAGVLLERARDTSGVVVSFVRDALGKVRDVNVERP